MEPQAFEAVYTWNGPPHIEFQRQVGHALQYPVHRLVVQRGQPGAVVVAHRNRSVVLVRSRRLAAAEELWEFPRGFGEPGDQLANCRDASVTAGVRELVEETGLRPLSAHSLGSYILDSSIYPSRVGVVWVEVADGEPAGPRDGEIEELRWVPLEDLAGLVARDTIRDAHTLAAVSFVLSSR
ncbi:hypothetical protein GCM10027449_16220 [Sinomonas notoginsengisoli]|uniref:NUDIX hydrolase n=1 Tax=Sinomonas notoginsengisoli TaxID=1457311 RepID=UPI003555C2E1